MLAIRAFRAAAPCIAVLLAGCHVWRQIPDPLGEPLKPQARVEIWSQGNNYLVHGVRARADSVIAVPYWLPTNCDSCAYRLPLTRIDSVRVYQVSEGRTMALVLGIGAALIWLGHQFVINSGT